jgi:hypothetical protein
MAAVMRKPATPMRSA